jgi:hypothetical protein
MMGDSIRQSGGFVKYSDHIAEIIALKRQLDFLGKEAAMMTLAADNWKARYYYQLENGKRYTDEITKIRTELELANQQVASLKAEVKRRPAPNHF